MVEVAGIVCSVPHDEAMVMAALLHDTVEDTETTIDEVRDEFGSDVADLVGWLTDVSKLSDGNRAIRKAIDCQHTSWAPARAKTIKLADLISNVRSILEYDPVFAKAYLPEKALLLEVLRDGDPVLWEKANKIVMTGLAQLQNTSKKKDANHDKTRKDSSFRR